MKKTVDDLHTTDGILTRSMERQENESYEDYKVRRDVLKNAYKQKLKGEFVFVSKIANLKGRTYTK